MVNRAQVQVFWRILWLARWVGPDVVWLWERPENDLEQGRI